MIALKNAGEMDIEVIRTMGVNVKHIESAIGYFGTGLKYAIAVFLREGVDFRLFIGANEYVFYTEQKDVRGKTFDFCMMRGPFDSCQLGFTTELGKNWEPWQAYREIESNCRDENGNVFDSIKPCGEEGYTTFYIEELEEYSTVFISDDRIPIYSCENMDVYEGVSDFIYYRGIRAKDISDRPSIYTYNIKQECTLTEDRLICYDFHVERAIARSVTAMQDANIIGNVINASNENYESTIDMAWDNNQTPSESFLEVFSSSKKTCNHSVFQLVSSNTPKPKMTTEMIAAKFREELDDFCSSHGVEYEIDGDGYVTLMAGEILVI